MIRDDVATATARMAEMLGPRPTDAAEELAALTAGPADAATLSNDPQLHDRLVAMLAAAFEQGHAGLAADIVSYTVADWGFRLVVRHRRGRCRCPRADVYAALTMSFVNASSVGGAVSTV